MRRRVFAIKGMPGARPGFQMAKGKTVANRLALVGVDTIKNRLFSLLQRGRGIRFSHTLEPVYYEQLASERRVIRYQRGHPVRRFEPVSSRSRSEALDALVYATAARQAINVPFDRRELELRSPDGRIPRAAALPPEHQHEPTDRVVADDGRESGIHHSAFEQQQSSSWLYPNGPRGGWPDRR